MKNLFHADYLQKVSDNSLSSQVQELKPLIKVNNKSEYIIKRILSSHVYNSIV